MLCEVFLASAQEFLYHLPWIDWPGELRRSSHQC